MASTAAMDTLQISPAFASHLFTFDDASCLSLLSPTGAQELHRQPAQVSEASQVQDASPVADLYHCACAWGKPLQLCTAHQWPDAHHQPLCSVHA